MTAQPQGPSQSAALGLRASVVAQLAWKLVNDRLDKPVSMRLLVIVVAAAQAAHLLLSH